MKSQNVLAKDDKQTLIDLAKRLSAISNAIYARHEYTDWDRIQDDLLTTGSAINHIAYDSAEAEGDEL